MMQLKTILFSDYAKYTSFKEYMIWDEYGLVENPLPTFAIERIQEKCISLLCRNYGHFNVWVMLEDNSGDYPRFHFPEFEGDLMTFFPELIQTLSITLKMLGMNVPEIDITTEKYDRVEDILSNQSSSQDATSTSDMLNKNISSQDNTTDSTQTTSGTVNDSGSSETDIAFEREIINTSEIDETGNRNVNLSHQMPEQAINGTGNFPVDSQGSPILSASYIQGAGESFSTINPMVSTETSNQKDNENKTITTNDLTQTTEGLTDTFNKSKISGESETSGTASTVDNIQNVVEGTGKNTISETRTTEKTNPQYAQEISKFLDNVQTINAFNEFINKFHWLCGIL